MSKQVLLPSNVTINVIKIALLSKKMQLAEALSSGRYPKHMIDEGELQLDDCLTWLEQFEEMTYDSQ